LTRSITTARRTAHKQPTTQLTFCSHNMDKRHKKRQRNRQFERARNHERTNQPQSKNQRVSNTHTQDPAKQTTTTTAQQLQPAQGTAASSDKTQTANKPGPIDAVHCHWARSRGKKTCCFMWKPRHIDSIRHDCTINRTQTTNSTTYNLQPQHG
jgi:hypothetical protein